MKLRFGRYMQAAFCSWYVNFQSYQDMDVSEKYFADILRYSTGGSISGLLNQLPLSQLNSSGSYQSGESGVMFEKVSF